MVLIGLLAVIVAVVIARSARRQSADIDMQLLNLIRILDDRVTTLEENQEQIMAALADTHAVQETRVFIPYHQN
jgi:ABC-type transporter Mla subunit MlaD